MDKSRKDKSNLDKSALDNADLEELHHKFFPDIVMKVARDSAPDQRIRSR